MLKISIFCIWFIRNFIEYDWCKIGKEKIKIVVWLQAGDREDVGIQIRHLFTFESINLEYNSIFMKKIYININIPFFVSLNVRNEIVNKILFILSYYVLGFIHW